MNPPPVRRLRSVRKTVTLLCVIAVLAIGAAVMPGALAARAGQSPAPSPHAVPGKKSIVKLVRIVPVAKLGKPVFGKPSAGDAESRLAPPRPPGRTKGVSTLVLTGKKAAAAKLAMPSFTRLRKIDGIPYTGNVPPDTQVAAGPGVVVEMVNNNAEVFSAKGPVLKDAYSLDSLFGTKDGTDPRVLYDRHYRVFFAAYELRTRGGDQIGLALTNDPVSGSWFVYNVLANSSNITYDQPRLGISDSTVMLAWDDYDQSKTGNPLTGEQFKLVDKIGLLVHAASVYGVIWQRGTQYFGVVPAVSESVGESEYAIYQYNTTSNNTTTSHAGVLNVQGVPGHSPVSYTETDLSIANESNPQPAAQPQEPLARYLDTSDTRFQSAVWRNNTLWAAGNSGCTPRGDSGERSCLRLLRLTTIDPVIKESDTDLGWPGGNLMYPAVVTDAAATLYISFSASSGKVYASSGVAVVPNGVMRPVVASTLFATGSVPLVCTFPVCTVTRSPTVTVYRNRFGDYSGIALDPTNPFDVWVASEYGGQKGSDPTVRDRWGTEIAEYGP